MYRNSPSGNIITGPVDITYSLGQNTSTKHLLREGTYSAVYASHLGPGEFVQEEVHDNTDQIFIVQSGSVIITKGAISHPVLTNELLMVPAGTRHSIRNARSNLPAKLLIIYSNKHHHTRLTVTDFEEEVMSELRSKEEVPRRRLLD